ncbi:MAG: hypothetical protein HQL73_03570 [Magnetococcales bacterium]|nr:hypothetical protein [Magnetococcales bacterium]
MDMFYLQRTLPYLRMAVKRIFLYRAENGEIVNTINMIIKVTGAKKNELAQIAGVEPHTIVAMASGKQRIYVDVLWKLAKHFHLSGKWLLTGKGDPFESDIDRSSVVINQNDLEEQLPGSYAMIPQYDVHVSAGGGAFVDSESIIDHMAFRLDWLRNTMRLQVGQLGLIFVSGDSMIPTLHPDDMILVDMRQQRALMSNSIYVVRVGGTLLVKRLQLMLDGSVRVKSDNPNYEMEVVPPGEIDQLNVVGRVVWAGKRM